MQEAIELHDSKLGTLSLDDGTAVLSFLPAYIHRSHGRPGVDAGSGWTQDATLTITGASLSASPMLPAVVFEGMVRIGDDVHRNIIPGAGEFQGSIVIELILDRAQTLIVRGGSLAIRVHGEPCFVEEFKP